MTTSSVSAWIQGLRDGDPDATRRLWERYFQQLVNLARKRLQGIPRHVYDEEDVALSVFNSLFEGLADGGFPRLTNRDELWQTLVLLTCRKAVSQWRRERAAKRGGHLVAHRDEITLETLLNRQPDPALAAMFADQVRFMLQQLPGDEFRRIAELRLQGYSQQEIAAGTGSSVRTVRRRLALIREIWEQTVQDVS